MKSILKLSVILFCGLALLTSCDNEPVDNLDIDELKGDSTLFQQLKTVAGASTDSTVCIKFVYPMTIFIQDSTATESIYNDLRPTVIENNNEFSSILSTTNEYESIGISYPIQYKSFDGRTLLIHNHAELKNAIDACPDVQILQITNGCADKNCILKVVSSTGDSRYEESLFDFYGPGYAIFYDQGTAYRIAWTRLYIEDNCYINMELEDPESEAAVDWSHNWRAKCLDGNTIKISNDTSSFLLVKTCDVENECNYVEFEACEKEIGSEVSDFVLEEYTPCILEQNTIEFPDEYEVNFYRTLDDYTNNTNVLDSSVPYTNESNPEIVFCKILNRLNNTEQLSRIVLNSAPCDNF